MNLPKLQEKRFLSPHKEVKKDFRQIYKQDKYLLGWPAKEIRIYDEISRKNSVAVIGVALGDEGKGRIIDNKIGELLKTKGVKKVYVFRFNGGNNSGHSIEKDGKRIAVHVVPSSILYKKAIGVIDRGVVVHAEDLRTEIEYCESIVGDLTGKVLVSSDTILQTDIERAEEVLNRLITDGAKGGTGRGIAPSYAHYLDRKGKQVYDLTDPKWREEFGRLYDMMATQFKAFGEKLSEIQVPDFKAAKFEGKNLSRAVGTKEEFLDRLKKSRNWLIKRDMVVNTFAIHEEVARDSSVAILFEGAQALGLHPWNGTRKDTTSSDTSAYGIISGTGFWRPQDIKDRIGIFKITYMSSVGARVMPTQVIIPRDLPEEKMNKDQKWARWVQQIANEKGTTTGRSRDICKLDLPFIAYNCRVAGIEVLIGTHLDIAQEGQPIAVCTHYIDKKGKMVPYQPGLRYQKDVIPAYIFLPGWDGELCHKAKSLKGLPQNAQKFLAFVQARIGYPVVGVTTGPERENFLRF